MHTSLDSISLDQLFLEARTFNEFSERPVDEETVSALYGLLKWAPTSMNCQPARYIFLKSSESRERLLPALSEGNLVKTQNAPMTVIIAYDTQFYEHLNTQFSAYDARPMFMENQQLAEATAFRNSSLQGAYLILGARALGLDCGGMSGFNPDIVNKEFFPDGRFAVNFLVNLGYGVEGGSYPRGPRLDFDQVAEIL